MGLCSDRQLQIRPEEYFAAQLDTILHGISTGAKSDAAPPQSATL
jgi:hypothetical protein